MDNFLYGLITGAVCVAVPVVVRGFVSAWRKDVAQKDYKEFKNSLDEFDHWYANYGNTPEYKEQLTKLNGSTMATETAINLQGTVVTITTSNSFMTLTKGAQFEEEMASTTGVIVGGTNMTLAEARRKWMHDKLDAWIDGVPNE